jgi:hypothetical protein
MALLKRIKNPLDKPSSVAPAIASTRTSADTARIQLDDLR